MCVFGGGVAHRDLWRQVHFGRRLAGVPHVCRFVDAFEEHAPGNVTHLWLVFRHEVLPKSKRVPGVRLG